MDKLCKLLSQTHISDKIISVDELILNISKININEKDKNEIDINNLNNIFNKMKISDNEIIEIINESNNLHDFCKRLLSIISERQ
jgi:hypothetical protein